MLRMGRNWQHLWHTVVFISDNTVSVSCAPTEIWQVAGEVKQSRARGGQGHALTVAFCMRRSSFESFWFFLPLAGKKTASVLLVSQLTECFFDPKEAGIHVDGVRPSGWAVAEEKPHTSRSFSVNLEEFLNTLTIVLALTGSLFTLASFCVSLTTGFSSSSPYSVFVSVMYVKLKPNVRRLLATKPGIVSLQTGGFILCTDWVFGTGEFHMMIQLIHHSVQMSVNHWVRETWPMKGSIFANWNW